MTRTFPRHIFIISPLSSFCKLKRKTSKEPLKDSLMSWEASLTSLKREIPWKKEKEKTN